MLRALVQDEEIEVGCPICDGPTVEIRNLFCETHARLLQPGVDLHQYVCQDCGHGVLRHDMPLDIIYNAASALPSDHSAGDIRFDFVRRNLDLGRIKGSVIEIGGGPGELAEQAREAVGKARAFVVDFVDRVSFPTLDFMALDLNAAPERLAETFACDDANLFLLSHVVEHLDDPAAVLAQLRRFENSFVYIEVPDFGAAHPIETLNWSLNCLDHTHHFNDRSLIELVQRAGFQVLAFETQGSPRLPAIRVLCTPRPQRPSALQEHNSHFGVVSGRLREAILAASADQPVWIWGLSAFMARAIADLGAARHRIAGVIDNRYPGETYLGLPVRAEPDGPSDDGRLIVCGSTYPTVQGVIRRKAAQMFPNAEFFTVPLAA